MKSLPRHINPKLIEYLCIKIWDISGSLRGVGALLQQQDPNPCHDAEDLFGLGQLLKIESEELAKLEDIIRSGHDSSLEEVLSSDEKIQMNKKRLYGEDS